MRVQCNAQQEHGGQGAINTSATGETTTAANQGSAEALDAKTGIPINMKEGFEFSWGCSLDSIKVHYNSSVPEEQNGAGTISHQEGKDIYLARGHDAELKRCLKALVIKNKQTAKDRNTGADNSKKQGDAKGSNGKEQKNNTQEQTVGDTSSGLKLFGSGLNVVGEKHKWIPKEEEKKRVKEGGYKGSVWHEDKFQYTTQPTGTNSTDKGKAGTNGAAGIEKRSGDPEQYRILFLLGVLDSCSTELQKILEPYPSKKTRNAKSVAADMAAVVTLTKEIFNYQELLWREDSQIKAEEQTTTPWYRSKEDQELWAEHRDFFTKTLEALLKAAKPLFTERGTVKTLENIKYTIIPLKKSIQGSMRLLDSQLLQGGQDIRGATQEWISRAKTRQKYSVIRSEAMHLAAQEEHKRPGIWKVGQAHVNDIKAAEDQSGLKYNLIDRGDYEANYYKHFHVPTAKATKTNKTPKKPSS